MDIVLEQFFFFNLAYVLENGISIENAFQKHRLNQFSKIMGWVPSVISIRE